MNLKQKSIHGNQEGVVAIVVTVIVLLVISLTALGLARLARREQQQSLDKQLSSEAFYLAESGVNDAVKVINDPTKTYTWSTKNREKCDDLPLDDTTPPTPSIGNKFDLLTPASPMYGTVKPFLLDPLGIGGSEGQYSCVLIKHDLDTIEYSSINTSKSSYADITSVNDAGAQVPLGSLTFGWQDINDTNNSFRSSPIIDFPKLTVWGTTTGILRLDLTDLNGIKKENDLSLSTTTLYLYPKGPDAGPLNTVTFGLSTNAGTIPQNKGLIVDGKCDATDTTAPRLRKCNVTINGLDGSHYFARLKAIYNPVQVSFKSGTPGVKIRGVQTQIDSTGKAADVLKRIQVRVPLRSAYAYPEYAVESVDGVCKRISVWPPGKYSSDLTNVNGSDDKAICDPTKD